MNLAHLIKKLRLIPLLVSVAAMILTGCASVVPKRAVRVAQPDNAPVRNFTSFSASLRCMDGLLAAAARPRVLVSSTGFPDLSRKVTVGADEMLVNAVNQMNHMSRAYVFVDQSLEKDWGQIDLLTPHEENLKPSLYIRAAVTQVDKGVVSDSGSLDLDLTDAPSPWSIFGTDFDGAKASAGRDVAVVTVDMHLVSFPDKTVVPGSSVANSMVVVSDSRGIEGGGLIRLTGFDFSIKISRVESLGQAVRNLAELGVIELLGRHARVPYWDCLNIRPTNQKLDNLDESRFAASPNPVKVRDIQERLAALGYFGGSASGKLDGVTRRAISQFQADEKLIANGVVNYDLYVRLNEKTGGFSRSREAIPGKTPTPSPTAIALLPDRQEYKRGDSLTLRLEVRRDGYVRCFHQSGNGPIVQILPVAPGGLIRAQTGSLVFVPNKNAPFDIKFESSGAKEAVLCLLNEEKPSAKEISVTASQSLKPVKARSFNEIKAIYRRSKRPASVAEFRTRARE